MYEITAEQRAAERHQRHAFTFAVLVVIFGSLTAVAAYVAFSSGAGVPFTVTPELQRASVIAMGVSGALALTAAALMFWGFWQYSRAVRQYYDHEFRDAR